MLVKQNTAPELRLLRVNSAADILKEHVTMVILNGRKIVQFFNIL